MYEHFRNAFLLELMCKYNTNDINYISNILDKVSSNYTILEKETALMVIDDNITRVVKMYLASKKLGGLANSTLKNYSNQLKIFFDTVQKEPQNITANDIRMFLFQYQLQTGIGNRTLDKHRDRLNCFFQWCVDNEYITKNPCKNVNKIRYEEKQRHALTRLQLEQIRRLCKTKRDLAIVDVLFSTACRVSELANMKFSDINTTNNSIHIIGKGRKHNTVYLNTNAILSLQDYIENERKGKSEYIFVTQRYPYEQVSVRTIQRLFDIIEDEINLTLSPHIIRHTTATLASKNGMPIEQIQKMLGHSNVATTQKIYVETSQEEVAISHERYVI